MNLWPRLPLPFAARQAEALAGRTLEDLEAQPWDSAELKRFAPTGGNPVPNAILRRLRDGLSLRAKEAGFPDLRSRHRAKFDDAARRFLLAFDIPFGEAIRAETWAWLAVHLVPHLVAWRFPERDGRQSVERYAGKLYRNAIGRLWYQATQLDLGTSAQDRLSHLSVLGEDQLVALFERPSLGAAPGVAQTVARMWHGLRPADRDEALFRESMKLLLVQARICRLDVLGQDDLDAIVRRSMQVTAERMGLPAQWDAGRRH